MAHNIQIFKLFVSESDKKEAKTFLERLLDNQLVSAIVGVSIGGLI